MQPADTLKLALIVAITVVLLGAVVMMTRMGTKAFSASIDASPKAFGLFFQQLPAVTAVAFLVAAATWVVYVDEFKKVDQYFTLLSGIAGYVLGGQRRSTSSQ